MTETRTLRFNANREKGRNDEQEFNTRLNDFKYERELEYIRQIKKLYGDIEVNAVYCNFDDGYGIMRQLICVATRFEVDDVWNNFSNVFIVKKNISDVLYEFENQAY